MSKLLKRIFIALIAIIGLFIILAVIAYFLIDANAFKQKIISQVNEATGRELTIDGDLDISFFPWLGLSANKVSLSNAPGFSDKPFASLDRAEFGIKIAPIFRKEIEADTITLHGLKLYLGVDKNGVDNWSDLAGDDSSDSEPEASSDSDDNDALKNLASFSLGGIDIRDAEIIWDDQQTPQKFSIRDFDLNSGAILPGKPVSLDIDFDMKSEPTIIDGDIKVSGITNIDLANKIFAVSDLTFDSTLNGPDLPVQNMPLNLSGDISMDLEKDALLLQNFTLKVLDILTEGQLTANQLSDNPQFKGQLNINEFSLRELLAKLDITIDTADPSVLAKTSLNVDFTGNTSKLNLTSLGATLDDTQLSGNFSVAEFSKPAIQANLKLDSIDLDRYLPPSEEEPEATQTSTGGSGGENNGEAAKAPVEDNSWMHPLRTLAANAQFDVGTLKINNLTMTQLATTLTAKGGLITLHPLTASLYNGSYQGNIQFNSNLDVPIISVNEILKDVAAGPLLKDLSGDDKIHGTASAKAKLTMRGSTPDQIKKTANGDIEFSFINGAINGFNIAQIIRDAKAKLAGKTSSANEPAKTDFAELSGSANIKSGLVQNQDLIMKSPFFRINGRGKANVITESINYLTEVSVVETSKGQGGKELNDLKGLTIPVKINGTFSEPKFRPDLKNLISEGVKQKAKEKVDKEKERLKGKLLDKLGLDGSKKENNGDDEKENTDKESTEDKLKNKLKNLF